MDPVDVRVAGDILSVEEIVERLISYNEEQCHETFLHGLHVCMICFREYTGNSDVPFHAGVLSLVLIFAPCYALDYL
jgi:hypothetical protein